MKKVVATVVFVCAIVVVKAQSEVTPPHAFSYQQKRWLDSLQDAHKQPAVITNQQPLLVYDMPVSGMKNEGEKIGLT